MKQIINLLVIVLFCLPAKAQDYLKAEKFFLQSKKFMSEKLYDKAIESIDFAIQIDSLNENYYLQKVDLYLQKSDCVGVEQTLEIYSERINPKTENFFLCASKLCMECFDKREVCLKILKTALEGDFGNSKKIILQIVFYYSQLDDNDNVIFYLKKYLELARNDVEKYHLLFDLLFVSDRFDEAENILLLGINENKQDITLLIRLSKYYYNRKKYESCISVLDKIIKKEYTIENIKNRIIVFEDNNQLEEAYNDYKKIIEIEKCNSEYYSKVLEYEYNNRMYKQVISNSLKAIKCNAAYEDMVIDGLYTSLFFCNDFKKGAEYLDKRLLSKPDKYLPYFLKAIVLFNQKSFSQALDYIDLALNCKDLKTEDITSINLFKYGIYLIKEDYEQFSLLIKNADYENFKNNLTISKEDNNIKKSVLKIEFDKKSGLIKTSLIVPNEIVVFLQEKYRIMMN